ncbi:hypothetical protein DXG03_002756, partial [Asterophora parasitica]
MIATIGCALLADSSTSDEEQLAAGDRYLEFFTILGSPYNITLNKIVGIYKHWLRPIPDSEAFKAREPPGDDNEENDTKDDSSDGGPPNTEKRRRGTNRKRRRRSQPSPTLSRKSQRLKTKKNGDGANDSAGSDGTTGTLVSDAGTPVSPKDAFLAVNKWVHCIAQCECELPVTDE